MAAAHGADTIRPEITVLTDEQKDRVLRQVRHRHATCRYCGDDEFLVGDALYLGFLFLSEDQDAYMVALTCVNPECPRPHTGIRLPKSEFLNTAGQAVVKDEQTSSQCSLHRASNAEAETNS